jgi:hypothetical protein
MRLARFPGLMLVFVFVLLVVDARIASACGVWSMRDTAKGRTIKYLINSLAVHATGKDGKAGRRLGALYFDEQPSGGLRVVVKGKVVLQMKGDKLVRRGKSVGNVSSTGEVTIGKQTFQIELTSVPPVHDMPTWKLAVKQGDQVIIESDEASALCRGAMLGAGLADPAGEEEVRRRVIYYLAWRVLGAP